MRTDRALRDVSARGSMAWILIAMAVGVVVRVWHLGTQSLWLDEAQFLDAAVQPTMKDLIRFLVEQDFHPPVYPIMLRYWLKAVGVSDLTVRLLPLLFGIALIPATAALARMLTGRRDVGVLAAAVVALNGYHLYLSQEGRHYTWLALIGVANICAFIKMIEGPRRWIVPFLLTSLAGLFSHYHMALVLVGEALLVLPKRRLDVLAAIAVTFVAFGIAWGSTLQVQLYRRSLWGEGLIDPGLNVLRAGGVVLANLGWTALDFTTGSYLRLVGAAGFDAPDLFKLAVAAAAAWCAIGGIVHLARHPRGGTAATGVLLCLGVLPLAGAVASGFLQANVYETKYVSFVAPLWAIVLGAGCRVALSGPRGRVRAVVLLAGLVASILHFHLEAMPWKEDWRHASAVLRREWRQGDLLLQRAPYTRFSLQHYLDFEPALLRAGTVRTPDEAMAESVHVEALNRRARRLWVVLSHDEFALETLRLLAQRMPEEESWPLQGVCIARFGVAR